MGFPYLQSCCGVLDLKTGNITIGVINAMMSIILTMFTIYLIIVSVYVSALVFFVVHALIAALFGVSTTKDSESEGHAISENKNIDEHEEITKLLYLTCLIPLLFFAKSCADVVFVYAVKHERIKVVKAYCIAWVVFFLLLMVLLTVNIIFCQPLLIAVQVFYMVFNIYAFHLGISFYKYLRERPSSVPKIDLTGFTAVKTQDEEV